MTDYESDTFWLQRLKVGELDAARPLWERYFHRLLGLARKRLAGSSRSAADEEDVALNAFDSFCRGAAGGKFAQLEDRHDLWQVLAVITARKAARQSQSERAQKRGGGKVESESTLAEEDASNALGIQHFAADDPTPELMAIATEEFERMLSLLTDESLREVALARLEGFSHAEIAARLGCHVRSVERKVRQIRELWSADES